MAIEAAATGFQRRRAAILFADVFGYSRLMSSDEQGTIDRVSRAIALFRLLIGDYGGEVINTAGTASSPCSRLPTRHLRSRSPFKASSGKRRCGIWPASPCDFESASTSVTS